MQVLLEKDGVTGEAGRTDGPGRVGRVMERKGRKGRLVDLNVGTRLWATGAYGLNRAL